VKGISTEYSSAALREKLTLFEKYDERADCESLIGEVKREGL